MMPCLSSRTSAFLHHEAAGGIVLLAAAAVALLLSNSPLVWAYDALLHTPVSVRFGDFAIDKPLLLWINDGLMAIFFFLIGLGVKREVLSGNLSSLGRAILPTPTIGAVGLLDDFMRSATLAFKAADEAILLIGETHGWLGQSLYLRDLCGREEGAPQPVDLETERRNGDFVRILIHENIATAAHDISDGGLLVAISEMAKAMAANNTSSAVG